MILLAAALTALAATTATATAATAAAADTPQEVSVVIVGAGYGGLQTARELARAGVDDMVILEAGSRVGGRAFDDTSLNFTQELGVEFLGDATQSPHAYKLFKEELGLEIYPSGAYTANKSFPMVCRDSEGKWKKQTSLLPGLFGCTSALAAAEAAAIVADLLILVKEVNASAPWAHPRAAEFDAISWDGYLRARISDEARLFINRGYAPGLSDAPERVSFLHALFLGVTGGGLIQGLTGFNNGFRIKEGGQAAALRMAAQLPDGSLRLRSPVARVDRRGASRILVETAAGEVFSAKHVVLTGSPTALRRIDHLPLLPYKTRRLLAGAHQGNSVRVSVVYESPWWLAKHLSGSVGDLLPSSYIYYVFDSSPPDMSKGVLQFHLCGDGGDALMAMPREARAAYLIKYIGDTFGDPEAAASYVGILGHDFGADEFVGGGFQANFPPGLWTAYGDVLFNDPAGDRRVHFAGTEWTPMGFGYVEGALARGAEVAATVAKALQAGGRGDERGVPATTELEQ